MARKTWLSRGVTKQAVVAGSVIGARVCGRRSQGFVTRILVQVTERPSRSRKLRRQ